MDLITPDKFHFVRSLIVEKGFEVFPLISAVLHGHQKGNIFVENTVHPQIILIITNSGFSQLFFLEKNPLSVSLGRFIFESNYIPFYFHIYDPPESLGKLLESHELVLKLRERQQLRYLSKELKNLPELPMGYKLVDCKEVGFHLLEPFHLELDRKFWASESDFIKSAYGVCILNVEKNPISICYCACIANGVSEVDIATLPEYRSKSFGKIATLAFINESISRGLMANWDCFSENQASLSIGLQTGFTLIKKYKFMSVYNELKDKKCNENEIVS